MRMLMLLIPTFLVCLAAFYMAADACVRAAEACVRAGGRECVRESAAGVVLASPSKLAEQVVLYGHGSVARRALHLPSLNKYSQLKVTRLSTRA